MWIQKILKNLKNKNNFRVVIFKFKIEEEDDTYRRVEAFVTCWRKRNRCLDR